MARFWPPCTMSFVMNLTQMTAKKLRPMAFKQRKRFFLKPWPGAGLWGLVRVKGEYVCELKTCRLGEVPFKAPPPVRRIRPLDIRAIGRAWQANRLC